MLSLQPCSQDGVLHFLQGKELPFSPVGQKGDTPELSKNPGLDGTKGPIQMLLGSLQEGDSPVLLMLPGNMVLLLYSVTASELGDSLLPPGLVATARPYFPRI